MQYHLTGEGILILPILTVNHAILSRMGEDSFAVLAREEAVSLLCVADGCGGLGSRRYPTLDEHTGAYAASRLAAKLMKQWGKELPLPAQPREGKMLQFMLQQRLEEQFRAFAKKNRMDAGRIVGSMQRILPTTLCALLFAKDAAGTEGCFLWAGDSRGYQLDLSGLHQYTQDDVKSRRDVLERLYGDGALSRCLSADQPIVLQLRHFHTDHPSVFLCATDGCYSCLPTPMELEMMLLSTMAAASDMSSWQRKLAAALRRLSNDDATLALAAVGFADFAHMKQHFAGRKEILEAKYILPVRKAGQCMEKARECWQEYRMQYECWEVSENGKDHWRL